MEEKHNEATPQRTKDHLLDAQLVSIDIPSFIEQINKSQRGKIVTGIL